MEILCPGSDGPLKSVDATEGYRRDGAEIGIRLTDCAPSDNQLQLSLMDLHQVGDDAAHFMWGADGNLKYKEPDSGRVYDLTFERVRI